MINLHFLLYVVATVCFVIAACPNGSRFRFEWFAAACLTLTVFV